MPVRRYFDDGKVSIYIAWEGDRWNIGRTEEEAIQRLEEDIDWRYVALSIMSGSPDLNDRERIVAERLIRKIQTGEATLGRT